MFVTSWMGILNIKTGKLTYVNAGHEPPLIKINNKYDWLISKPNFVLGGLENIQYDYNEITLNDGDRILLYTDGVSEANDRYNGFFGKERLIKNMEQNLNLSIEDKVKFIKNKIDEFTDGEDQFDDITIFLMEFKK